MRPFLVCRFEFPRIARWGVALAVAALTAFLVLNADAANPDPRRPSAIETRDVPLVPPEIVSRLAQYQSVRTAEFRGWAPDGNGILIWTRFGNAAQLHRVYQPGGRREQVTFFEEPTTGKFLPGSGDGAMLASLSAGGNENYQIYLVDPTKFQTTLLTDGKSRNEVGPVTDDGSAVAIASTRRNGRDTDLYVADPRQADSMKLVLETNAEFYRAADWSPDGHQLLLERYVSINESYLSILDVRSREKTEIPMPGEGKSAVSPIRYSADGRSILLATDATSEFRRLARYDLQRKSFEWLTEDIDWDVSDLEVDRRSGNLALAVNAGGASRLLVIVDGKRRELPIPLGIVSGIEFSPDGSQLGFTLARPEAPAEAYSLRWADGTLTRWTYSEVGGLDPATFVVPTRIEFPTFDQRQIPAYYFRPRGASPDRKVGVLINIHGGPEGQYQPFFSGMDQYLVNELGVAVIAPNVRGSAGYGKTYLKLDNAELREDSVRDIGALLDWIAAQPELDSTRVAVYGGSYGGYMVLASLVHHGERIKAGIDNVGIANFITFLENTAPYRRDLRRAEYGDERDPAMRKVFERINPSSSAEKIKSALLVAHGRNDPRVPFSEAEQIAERVRAQGRTVWTVYADNEGHGFAKKDNADYVRAVQVLFLKTHIANRD